ncbi:MAG TPA: TIM barrel protein [Gemmatimonadaceae bacterium]|nr:TIM barrel protein [Gemmatimonadaceae bacterium]
MTTRRELLAGTAALAGAFALPGLGVRQDGPGRLRQSVCRWPFNDVPLGEFCRQVKAMGIEAIDLLTEDEWPIVRDAGLACSMGTPTKRRDFISTGLNDRANHVMLLNELERGIKGAKSAGVPNVIAMPGNRRGKSDAEVVDVTAEALKKIAPLAEQEGVTICLEMLNSKVDHKDFSMDRTSLGVAICKAVGSPRVRLLYDIYHMQIMEGDVIRTLRDNLPYIAHFHTAGVPGRHELDDKQELFYPAIARAIADTGFSGYFAHEFIPTRTWNVALGEAVEACKV